jgi:toxin-antitoxin system PIN domain toxin
MSSSRIALLDVNLLLALFVADHVHHDVAHDWFADHRADGWATCSITENGLVRILANPRYETGESTVPAVIDRLRQFRASGEHHFWPNEISLTDTELFDTARFRGHRQLTDVYLLGLARHHGGCLATLDRSIPLAAVRGATRDTLQIIEPASED